MGSAAAPVCPNCKQVVTGDSTNRPFCSSRCKWVDLGHWLDGDYVVLDHVVEDGAVFRQDGGFPSEAGRNPETFGLGGRSEVDADDR